MTTAVVRHNGQPLSLELVIAAWLDAKFGRSHSNETGKAYRRTLAAFRRFVEANHGKLDGNEAELRLMAQAWARLPWRGSTEAVANTTYNQRLAIVSSFYNYFAIMARDFGYTRVDGSAISNPILYIERGKVQDYAGAVALSAEDVRQMLATIDRSAPIGKRDFALLAVALQTGRRLTELASMRLDDLATSGGLITVRYPRTKGAKSIADQLTPGVSRILREWLDYRAEAYSDRGDGYVWLNLSRYRNGRPLGIRSISEICLHRLGTSKVHTTRHTFANEMIKAGATVRDVQRRLQHSNSATTEKYLAQLSVAENSKAGEIATAFGFEE